jgi:hypothetical protein
MVAGIHVKGKGPLPKRVAAAVEGAGQVRADEPRAPRVSVVVMARDRTPRMSAGCPQQSMALGRPRIQL